MLVEDGNKRALANAREAWTPALPEMLTAAPRHLRRKPYGALQPCAFGDKCAVAVVSESGMKYEKGIVNLSDAVLYPPSLCGV